MKKLVVSSLILVMSVFVLLPNGALAQTRTVGVSVGDTFKYTYKFNFSSDNDTNSIFPSVFETVFDQAKEIEWGKLTILDIHGVSVTVQTLLHFKNGTEQSSVSSTDLQTGQGNLTMFLVASNLNQNDPVYMGQPDTTINETLVRNYASGSRQVNHQSITMDYSPSQEELTDLNMTVFQQHNAADVYWDRQLGVLVEMSYNMMTRSSTYNANITMNVNLVESNALVVPEFPIAAPLVLAVLASVIAAVLYGKKGKNRKTNSQTFSREAVCVLG